jgi:hypothetical protein
MTEINRSRTTRFVTSLLRAIACAIPAIAGAQDIDDSVVIWQPDTFLSPADFRKQPPAQAIADAQSWTGIDFNADCWQGDFSFQVYAIFHRDSSWLAPDKATPYVLSHEKMHFDISELYTRKLRASLSALASPCRDLEFTQARIDSIVAQNEAALVLEQKRFDRQTQHGTNRSKQHEWQEEIKQRLTALTAYSENAEP